MLQVNMIYSINFRIFYNVINGYILNLQQKKNESKME